MKPNGIQAYVEHEARAAGMPPRYQPPLHERPVPPLSDPLATTIRQALDSHKLTELEAVFVDAQFTAGEPVQVIEHRKPGES